MATRTQQEPVRGASAVNNDKTTQGYHPTPAGKSGTKAWSSIASLSAQAGNTSHVQFHIKSKQKLGKQITKAGEAAKKTPEGKQTTKAGEAEAPEANSTICGLVQKTAAKAPLWSRVAAFRNPKGVAVETMTAVEVQYWTNEATNGNAAASKALHLW